MSISNFDEIADKLIKIPFMKEYGFPSVGQGWYPLLLELCSKINELQPDIKIQQVKEKFGELRFYVESALPEVGDLIDRAEDESTQICEECGSRENVTTSRIYKWAWIKTSCQKCIDEYNEREKKKGDHVA